MRIVVADNGVGIAKDHLTQIWDRFYKVDPVRTIKNGRGSGLGLNIVKLMVEKMGGEVTVESAPGKGSTFSFTLPCA